MNESQPLLFAIPDPVNSAGDAAAIVRATRLHADLTAQRQKALARRANALRQLDYHERELMVDERLFERGQRRSRDVSRRHTKIQEWQRRVEEFAAEAEVLAAAAERVQREAVAALAQDTPRANGTDPKPAITSTPTRVTRHEPAHGEQVLAARDDQPKEEETMNATQLFPGRFLKARDLDSKKPTAFIINRLTQETVGEEREEKWVLYFENETRGLVLNRTNTDALIEGYGLETEEWLGKVIHLYVARVSFGANMVDAIRVRIPAPDDTRQGEEAMQTETVPF